MPTTGSHQQVLEANQTNILKFGVDNLQLQNQHKKNRTKNMRLCNVANYFLNQNMPPL